MLCYVRDPTLPNFTSMFTNTPTYFSQQIVAKRFSKHFLSLLTVVVKTLVIFFLAAQ